MVDSVNNLSRSHGKTRVFTEVTFFISAEYGIPCGSDFTSLEFRAIFHCLIMRNSVEFCRYSAEFRAILCTEFRIRNLSNKCIQETLDFFLLKSEVEIKNINFAFVYLNYIPYRIRNVRK
jgi:hypothetical protein